MRPDRRGGLIPIALAFLAAALTATACGTSAAPDDALDTVAREVRNDQIWELQGLTLTDVEVVESSRLVDDDVADGTWCVAVDATTSDPAHYLHGPAIWLTSENDDGTWRVTPTFIIAVKDTRNWFERCGMDEPEPS